LLEAFKLIRMKLSVIPPLEIGGHDVEIGSSVGDCVRNSTLMAALISKNTLKKAEDPCRAFPVARRPCSV
jgi:hypothetical protein